jgi:exosortase
VRRSSNGILAAIVFAAAAFLYWPVVTKLVRDWWGDADYTHAFVVVPLAAFLAWQRRGDWVRTSRNPSAIGLLVVIAAFALLAAGTLGSELFLTRISLIIGASGVVVFLFGWRHLRLLAFPIALIVLAIPIPTVLMTQLLLSLQLWASRIAEETLWVTNVPVLREGNVLVLPNASLEVAEACSGIRSLMALVTVGLVVARFTGGGWMPRTAVVLSAIPIAVLLNGLRVAATALIVRSYGVAAMTSFLHELIGWVMFVVAFVLMAACARAIGLPSWRDARVVSA